MARIPLTAVTLAAGAVLLARGPRSATSTPSWPSWVKPNLPYVDPCMGKAESSCGVKGGGDCAWVTEFSPMCVNQNWAGVQPPPRWDAVEKPLVSMFFEFFAGVHLSEGSYQRFYYNTDVTMCAELCLASAGGGLNTETFAAPVFGVPQPDYVFVRCLSFDFFPFEEPVESAPYYESPETGVCVLNSNYRENARLRNVDQGLTDSELFASSFYEYRPFSALEGYYEVRDTRGAGIAAMLNYNQGGSLGDSVRAWGGSRWGSAALSVPVPMDDDITCVKGVSVSGGGGGGASSMFTVGFTPVREDSKCPGLVTKAEAEAMCQWAGGALCPNQQSLNATKNIKLGCSFDGYPMWTQADVPGPGNAYRFPRCCGQYEIPVNCGYYVEAAAKRCASFLTDTACLWGGSGTARQLTLGFGHALPLVREHCVAAAQAGASCSALLIQTWTPRDQCIWCPTWGSAAGGGQGVCRPAGMFGICPNSESTFTDVFQLTVRNQCTANEICALVDVFPDLAAVLGTS